MRKTISVLVILALFFSISNFAFAAKPKKKPTKKKPAPITRKVEVPRPPLPPTLYLVEKAILIEGGYVGGSAVLGIGYLHPVASQIAVRVGLGYGLGQNARATVMPVKIGAAYHFSSDVYGGLTVDYGNYLANVQDVLGVGNVNSGGRVGAGLMLGRIFGKWQAEVGFSTALGVLAVGGYRF